MGQRYGQHFLHDQGVLSHIAQTIDDLARQYHATTILEIGPGKGALTEHLLRLPFSLVLSEIDETVRSSLEHRLQGRSTPIVWGDVLSIPLDVQDDALVCFGWIQMKLATTMVVGNLPYYITSPILRRFFAGSVLFPAGVFLIQHEVADKIRRDASKKSYLRRLVNNTHQVTYCFPVKAGSFVPPPKVLSAVVSLQPLSEPHLSWVYYDRLLTFLDLVSSFKRKTLWKIQKMQQEKFDRHDLSIPDYLWSKRLEELGWVEMKAIVAQVLWM